MTLIDATYFQQQTTTLGLKSSFIPAADVLTVLIGEASDWVEGYCRRRFGAQTITDERHWGSGRGRLILNEFPVSAVTAITAVDSRGSTATAFDVADVRITPGGMLELIDSGNVWFRDRLYSITYTLPDPVPGPVKRATALKVVDLLDPQYFPGKTKSVELVTSVQEQMVTLLEDFRRERIG